MLDKEGDGIFTIKEAIDAYTEYCAKKGENETKEIHKSITRIFKELNCRHLEEVDE
jgi:hypothetical protein